METLEKAINDFFSQLELFSAEWIETSQKSCSVFSGLRNQSEQIQLLERCNWSSDLLNKFPDVKEKLKLKILYGLNDEASQLSDIRTALLSLKKRLNSKFAQIEKTSHKQNLGSCISFGEIAPPAQKFIEYAEDVVRYYSTLFINIDYALICLDYKDKKTITDTEEAFQKSMSVGKLIEGYILLWKTLENLGC